MEDRIWEVATMLCTTGKGASSSRLVFTGWSELYLRFRIGRGRAPRSRAQRANAPIN